MQDSNPNNPYEGNFLPPENMGADGAHVDNPQDLPFFDNTPGTSPEERQDIEAVEKKGRNKKRLDHKKKAKKSAKQIKKYNGVFALPVYLATYRCMMECRFRFRNTPRSSRYIAREIEARLIDIMADISMVYWNVQPYTSLVDTYKEVLRVEVMIRSLRDSRIISAKDFGCICQYTASMVVNMVKWSNKYNPDHQQINALSGLDVLSAQYDIPRRGDSDEEDAQADSSSESSVSGAAAAGDADGGGAVSV